MLNVEHLNIRYPNGVLALRDVNLSLSPGKIYGILGPSGAGKSSLLKGMLGLVRGGGRIEFDGKPLQDYAKDIAYVEQKERIDRDFPITVLDCVLLGTYQQLGMFQRPGKRQRDSARLALESVGLTEVHQRQIGELSGGQFQRVLIARALVQKPRLLFLDEPFVGLDVDNEAAVMQSLRALRDTGATIFIVHHDLSKVRTYFDDVVFIHQEVIAHGPVETTFTDENIDKTFDIPRGMASETSRTAPRAPWVKQYGHHAVRS